jgi:aldehyde dehydrogenase (NAD+)
MKVKEIFETMEYGPAPESAQEAHEWLAQHKNKFELFVDGKLAGTIIQKIF